MEFEFKISECNFNSMFIPSQNGFLFLKMLFVFICVCLLICSSCACRCQQTPEEYIVSSGIRVTVDQCVFWEPNLGPLKEQQVRLTSEPSLQISSVSLIKSKFPWECVKSHSNTCIYFFSIWIKVGCMACFYFLCHLGLLII